MRWAVVVAQEHPPACMQEGDLVWEEAWVLGGAGGTATQITVGGWGLWVDQEVDPCRCFRVVVVVAWVALLEQQDSGVVLEGPLMQQATWTSSCSCTCS